MKALSFYLANVHIHVHGVCEEALLTLYSVFERCSTPLVSTTVQISYTLDAEGCLLRDGIRMGTKPCRSWASLAIEKDIYWSLQAWVDPTVMLHASLVVWKKIPVFFVGDSGSGKSTLARAAVADDWDYFGDDIAFLNRTHIWGLPRSIQFNPIQVDAEVPNYLDGFDLERYQYVNQVGQNVAAPLFSVPESQIPERPLPMTRVRIFFLCRGDELALEPLPSLEALQGVYNALLHEPRKIDVEGLDLAAFLSPLQCFKLHWRDAQSAIQAVKKAISNGITARTEG